MFPYTIRTYHLKNIYLHKSILTRIVELTFDKILIPGPPVTALWPEVNCFIPNSKIPRIPLECTGPRPSVPYVRDRNTIPHLDPETCWKQEPLVWFQILNPMRCDQPPTKDVLILNFPHSWNPHRFVTSDLMNSAWYSPTNLNKQQPLECSLCVTNLYKDWPLCYMQGYSLTFSHP